MKTYCYQLSTGVIFRTSQYIVYTHKGYCIDRQAVTPEESNIRGMLTIPGTNGSVGVSDMLFRSKDIVAEWLEND